MRFPAFHVKTPPPRAGDEITGEAHVRLKKPQAIKFIVFEIVVFVGFLFWLADKVRHDYETNLAGERPRIAREP